MANAAKKSRTAAPVAAAEVPEVAAKPVSLCLWSGEPTSSAKSRFLPGNDAKLKSVLLKITRGEAKLSAIPKPAMKLLKTGEPLVGFQFDADSQSLSIVGKFKVAAPKEEAEVEEEETLFVPEPAPARRRATAAKMGSGAGARAARRAAKSESTDSE